MIVNKKGITITFDKEEMRIFSEVKNILNNVVDLMENELVTELRNDSCVHCSLEELLGFIGFCDESCANDSDTSWEFIYEED